MPVIVTPDKYDVWLDPDVTTFEMIRDILKPNDANLMRRYPVSRKLNSSKIDDAESASPAGWILHFVVGISFANIYTFLVMPRLSKISSPLGKGIIFGLIAFLIAMISLPAMGAIFRRMPPMVASMPSITAMLIIEHVIFGIAVVLIFDKLST